MAILNTYLNSLATQEGVTAYLAISTSTDFDAYSVTETSIPGEYSSRISMTASVVDNVVTWSGIKSGASVPASGITYTGMALFTASSGGTLMFTAPLASTVHTTNFDIEFNWEATYTRR